MGIEAGHEYDASAMGQERHRALEIGFGGGVPVNVDTPGRKVRNRLDHIAGLIIDRSLGTQLPAILKVALAASRDDDSGAKIGSELEHSRTDVARTAVYEDGFASAQLRFAQKPDTGCCCGVHHCYRLFFVRAILAGFAPAPLPSNVASRG